MITNLKPFIVFLIVTASWLSAFAEKDPENYHVQVVMATGDTITGYIRNDLKTGLKNMFSKTGSIRQYINVSDSPDGGTSKRYSSSEIKEYRFLEPNEAYPDGKTCISEMINQPGLFKPLRYVRGLAWEYNKRESGSILGWDVFESTGGRNSVSRLVPATGIKLKGAPAAFPIIINKLYRPWYLMHYLKKNYPELHKAWENYYDKGKDSKAHRKELLDNPSTALLFYEEFLKNNPPLNDEQDQ